MKFKQSFLITAQAALFLLFLVITSWFNRFSADDFQFIGKVRDFGISEMYKQLFFQWNGRWTYNFLILIVVNFHEIPKVLFGVNVLSFGLLIYAIIKLLKQLNIKLELNASNRSIYQYAFIFCGVFFFFTHSTGQSWFWVSASLAYLWSCIFFLLGLSSLLNKNPRIWDFLIVCISGLYVGGSNEVLSICAILLLIVSIKWGFSPIKRVALFVVLVSFSINYFSPGTTFRDELTPNLSLINLIFYVGYGVLDYLILNGYKTILLAIVFAFPFYLLGKKHGDKFNSTFQFKKELIITMLFLVAVVFINQFIVIYALGGLAPERSTITSSLLGSMAIARFLFLFGASSKESTINLQFILPTVIVLMIIFNGVFFVIHKNYSTSFDERLEFIETNQKQEVLKLKKLANSGCLNSAEITSDSLHFLNQHLKYGLGIKGQLVLKED